MESMRASTTDDNAAFADSDKSNVKIYFLTVPYGTYCFHLVQHLLQVVGIFVMSTGMSRSIRALAIHPAKKDLRASNSDYAAAYRVVRRVYDNCKPSEPNGISGRSSDCSNRDILSGNLEINSKTSRANQRQDEQASPAVDSSACFRRGSSKGFFQMNMRVSHAGLPPSMPQSVKIILPY